jgi:predicted nuclease with TOPRIM domain
MSSAEKALGMIKAVLTYQERFDSLEKNLGELSDRLTRLADSHASLRDRVSTIEGYLHGRSDQAAQPRLPSLGS